MGRAQPRTIIEDMPGIEEEVTFLFGITDKELDLYLTVYLNIFC